MNLLRKLAVISILLSPLAANADLITADFTGTFRSSDNSLYTEGFQFLFSLTYPPYDSQTYDVTLSTNLIPTYSGIAEDGYQESVRYLVAGGNGHPNLFFQNNDNFSFGFEWFDDGFFTDTLPDGSNVYGWGSSNWTFRNDDGELLVEQLAFYITDVKYTHLPEPGTLGLLVIGLAGMGLARRRRTQ